MATTTTKPQMMIAKEACVIVVGARPIEYRKRIVRDRHTGQLAEIDIHDEPYADPGDEAPATSSGRVRLSRPITRQC